MESMNMEVSPIPNGRGQNPRCGVSSFQLPVNYPRYTKAKYETIPEWKLNRLFTEYGLLVTGNLEQKRNPAIGAFLWPNYSEKGDYYRYLAEYKADQERKDAAEQSLKGYQGDRNLADYMNDQSFPRILYMAGEGNSIYTLIFDEYNVVRN